MYDDRSTEKLFSASDLSQAEVGRCSLFKGVMDARILNVMKLYNDKFYATSLLDLDHDFG